MNSENHIKSPTHSESIEQQTQLTDEESFNLPEDVIQEILLRLPVKSLLKFGCVSKSWLSLISSKQFVKTHTRVSTENSKLNGQVIVSSYYPQSNLIRCSLRSLLPEQPLTYTINIDYPMKDPPMNVWMVGPCDGLICLAMDIIDLFLWNQSIKEFKKLPSMTLELVIYYNYVTYGFGFDEFDDDYKVVGVLWVNEEGRNKYILMVYSLRTDSWTRVGDLRGDIRILESESIKFVSGKIHWLATPEMGPNFRWDIVCLDLESGVYGTLEQPDYGEDCKDHTFVVLGGCLCVIGYDLDVRVDVWVMKEYGVKGSWSKVFHFSCIDYDPTSTLFEPVCLLLNGEILLLYKNSFIVCNPRYGSFKVRKATNLDIILDADIFVESLVSPGANCQTVM